MDKKPVAGQEGQDGLFASSVFDKTTGEIIIKVINTSKQSQPITLNLQDVKGERTAETLTLSYSGSLDDENTLDQPEKITPKAGTVVCTADKKQAVLTDQLPAMSFRLYKIKK
jgi:alpha-L-arabinofuranosidase